MAGHVSVLLKESIDGLNIKEDGVYLDLTLGRGGHSEQILRRAKKGRLICFDLDLTAIAESEQRLKAVGDNFTLIHDDFSSFPRHLAEMGIEKVDGILADLGVSSPQFDDGERGFSYRYDAYLDMRMNQEGGKTASDVVNSYSLADLTRIIGEYGDEKGAYRIARSIIAARPIKTTFELVEAIKRAKTKKELSLKGHPAKQTFQAIRIEVNGEEDALDGILKSAPDYLAPNGRLAIITFMSMDDRKVKRRFRELSRVEGDRLNTPLTADIEPLYNDITPHPITPSDKELSSNPRSASAKLRILERKEKTR